MSGLALNPIPHAEGIALLKGKPAVTRRVFDQLLPELKGLAFTVTGIEAVDVLQRSRDIIAGLPQGRTWEAVKADLLGEISPWLISGDDDEELAASARGADRRAELLMRLHGFNVYEVAHSRVMEEMGDVFTHWRWQTMGDVKVRPSHAAMDGITLPASSPFWRTTWPRRGYLCRCQLVGITAEEAAAEIVKDRKLDPEKRKYLEGAPLAQLEQGGIINRGPSTQFNLAKEAATGPHRQFGNLKLDPDELKDRYDADVWDEFERFAKAQEIAPGQTVWGWMSGLAPAPRESATAAVAGAFPESLSALKVIKSLGGSTGAQLVEDVAGNQWVMKSGASADHLREEVTADELYRALGVDVPEVKLYEDANGKPVKLARFVEGQSLAERLAKATSAEREALIKEISKGLYADVLLGNWDVTGMNNDNIIVDAAGKPWRIDNGGSLRFRAMGTAKTSDEWNDFPDELWSLRDPSKLAGKVFKDVRLVHMAKQLEGLQVPDLDGLAAELKATLEARAKHLRDLGTKALDMEHDGWRDSYTDELCKHILGLRKAGISAQLPKELKQAVEDVMVVDENGKPWDHLRTSKTSPAPVAASAAASGLVKGDTYFPSILAAAKNLNHHSSKGTPATYNATKVNAALAQLPTLQKLAAGKGQKAALAKLYVQHIDWVQKAADRASKGSVLIIPDLTPYTPKKKKKLLPAVSPLAQSTGVSLVQQLADYAQANGGDLRAVKRWKKAQGGSSWNEDAQAKKAWVARHLNLAAAKVYWHKPATSAVQCLKAMEADLGKEAVDVGFTVHHAFMQELLASSEVRHNDRQRRVMRLVRTEQKAALNSYGILPGAQNATIPRGLCESSSPFRITKALGGTYEGTVQAVPHSKVLGSYLMEATPGQGDCGFLTDAENEFTFVGADIPFHYAGDIRTVNIGMDAGNDAGAWSLPLQHLRNQP